MSGGAAVKTAGPMTAEMQPPEAMPAGQRMVIGIHDGHNASVALLSNGRLALALQEERFSRVKNQGDEPRAALSIVMTQAGGSAAQTPVALNGFYINYGQWRRETILDDYSRSSSALSRMKQPFKNTIVDRWYRKRKAEFRAERLAAVGIPPEQQRAVEHHSAHAAAAYYMSPWRGEKTLVFTCDGSGDRLSATVSIGEGRELRRIAAVSEHDSIGRFYALITRWMGMAPLEHEYKVMGLAPYVSTDRGATRLAESFAAMFQFSNDGMSWRRNRDVPSMYSAYDWFGGRLRGQRFDIVAGGAQMLIERMLVRWIQSAIRETGIRRIACGGGVFMNVKANLAVLGIEELDDMFVFPSCGDESNSIGAACVLAAEAGESIEPLKAIYFGQSIEDADVELALSAIPKSMKVRSHWVADIEQKTAQALAQGKIVARVKGPGEFGARALGNRSILARADSPAVVRVINQMVKNRDFWMPFAPSVLAEHADRYCAKPKAIRSPYMMFAFPSRPEKREAFSAGQHPYDFTARLHEVSQDHNADYHRLLSEYHALTGESIVLNTSFNLHGEPMVYRASEAVDVFLRSGLEHMALGNCWLEKQ